MASVACSGSNPPTEGEPEKGSSSSNGEGTEAGVTGDSSGTGAVDETGTEPPADPFVELSKCEELDFEGTPMMGPAFDPETGALLAPLEPPFVVATTVGWAKDDAASQEILSEHSNAVVEDVFQYDGLLGASFGGSEACGNARTLTLWADSRSLAAFVFGRVHAAAIDAGRPEVKAWATTHWTETESTEPPSWEEAVQRIIDARAGGD